MSIYRALGIDVPVILFSVIHQARPDADPGRYARTAAGFQRGVWKQDREIRERMRAWLDEEAGRRAVEAASRAALPVREGRAEGLDREALAELLREDLRAWAAELTEADGLGLVRSWECRVAAPDGVTGDAARLRDEGARYLGSLGMEPGQGSAIHESLFLFRGSVHYDVVEHLVRDMMGIYVGPHGALVEGVRRALFGTFNLLHHAGEAGGPDGAAWEVNLPFSKGPVQYGEFRAKLNRAVEALHGEFGGAASAWQRKLGLGQVREFSLRVDVPRDPDALQRALDVVAASDAYLAEGVVRRGRMVVMERLPV